MLDMCAPPPHTHWHFKKLMVSTPTLGRDLEGERTDIAGTACMGVNHFESEITV